MNKNHYLYPYTSDLCKYLICVGHASLALGGGGTFHIESQSFITNESLILKLKDPPLWGVNFREVKTCSPSNLLVNSNNEIIWQGLTYRDYDPQHFLSKEFFDHFGWQNQQPQSVTEIEGEVIFIGGCANFGHMLFEFLSRAYIISRITDERGALPLVVYDDVNPGAHTLLRMLFPAHKVITVSRRSQLAFRNVWVGSVPFGRNLSGEIFASQESLFYLREDVRKKSGIASSAYKNRSRSRLYFSRRRTQQKRLVNEDVLIPTLKAEGFQIIDPADYSMRDQLEQVLNAEIIMGPLGAATSIAMLAPRDCRIIELVGDRFFGMFNAIVSSVILGQPYQRVVGRRVRMSDNTRPEAIFADFVIQPEAFHTIVKKAVAGG
jgi:hypothetical protein